MKRPIFFSLTALLFVSLAYTSEQLEHTRSIVKEWVTAEQALSKEALAWKEKEALLNDLIRLTEIELKQLKAEIEVVETFVSTADERREKLILQEERIKRNTKVIKNFLYETERKALLLKKQLPPSLQEQLVLLYQRLPLDSQKTSLGIAERMQTVVAIFSKIQEFDAIITVAEEARTFPDGSRGVVKALYLGLAAAYYLSADENDAGYGYPSEEGWVWESLPKKQKAIRDAIAIAENTSQEARFIPLPITLNRSLFAVESINNQ